MATVFDTAHAHVAEWEGGYSNHPNDSGGVTNYGISLEFLKDTKEDLNGDGVINAQDVRSVTPEKAKQLFKKYFWDGTCAKNLPSRTAIAYYDLAVNAGAKRANKVLQEALGAGLVVDGVVGNKTMEAVRHCDDFFTAVRFCLIRKNWYESLCEARPSYKVFLSGWLNRTKACLKLVVKY